MEDSKVGWRDVAIILSLCLGSISYGYDFSIISTTIGQPTWYAYMGLSADQTSSKYAYSNSMLGTVFGLFSTGAIFGGLFVGWYSDAYGRKRSLVIASIINIIGGALQAGSVHIAMFIVARMITGFAAAMMVTLVPIYIAEVAPPAIRGFLVGQHGGFFVFGYMIAAWVGVGSFYSTNAAFNWRFPLSLQALWPMLQLCFIKWLPESPRWLVKQGRSKEAWNILARLHSRPGQADQLFAREEFFQISAQCKADQDAYGNVNYVDLFRRPHFRKRALIATLVMWASQCNGAIVIYSNIVVLVAGLGFSASASLFLTGGWITLACVGNFVNTLYIDKLGRIRSLMIGMTGCAICTIIEAAIIANYGGSSNRAALAAGVAMLFVYICFYSGFVDATLYVYCAEIFPTHIRAKGMGWSIAIFMLSTIPFLESSATGFATIGWKYYLLFIILPMINVVLLGIFCPETKGHSLEEINALFDDEVAVQMTHLSEEEKRAFDDRINVKDLIIEGAEVPTPSEPEDLEKNAKLAI